MPARLGRSGPDYGLENGSGWGWGTLRVMRVFGIDCGTEITGFGVVESDEESRNPRLICQAFGAIRLSKQKTMPERLKQVDRKSVV